RRLDSSEEGSAPSEASPLKQIAPASRPSKRNILLAGAGKPPGQTPRDPSGPRRAARGAGPETSCQIATVHRERVSGDVARVVGGEEEGGPRHVVGLAEAAQRDALHPPAPRLFGQAPR